MRSALPATVGPAQIRRSKSAWTGSSATRRPSTIECANRAYRLMNVYGIMHVTRFYHCGRLRTAEPSPMLALNQVSAYAVEQAREAIERTLCPNGPVSPHSGAVE